MNGTTEDCAEAREVFDSVPARVTAGLAKVVDAVKKQAPVMYAPT